MPEIPNVVSGAVIASEWGNDIRDRTIQRYLHATERTALHVTPVTGDLSYLEDTGLCYVFFNGTWNRIGGAEEVDGAASGAGSTTTSYVAMATLNLAIPTSWDEWKGVAQVTFAHSKATVGNFSFRLHIDGTDGAVVTLSPSTDSVSAGHQMRRAGIITTGSRAIQFQIKHDAGSAAVIADVVLYARAVRTA